ncbi:hypothetical protein JCM8115_006756 [Rhodotorula mucilaginosa]|uniref:Protein kinase domain-containing protein n=1 Tax=Rhodotorula mucilaginosa TaxID=5537 RepID=A0A9P6W319_RHOMI|nr:hypothetical protein C6P46_004094 [Rhodotorula mucilaginosa]
MAQDEQQAAFSPIVRQHSRTSSQFANNLGLSLSPLTTTAPSLPSPTLAAEPRRDHDHEAAAARRRSNPFTSVDPTLTTRPRSGTTTPALPPTDPWTPAQSAFPSTSTSLAQFIQTKRRQASAPYFASARSSSLFSPGAGFSLGPEALHPEPPEAATQTTNSPPASRNRSRASSRRATATGGLTPLRTHGLESFAQIAQHDDAGLVPTPTIEEWRQLGSDLNALADLRVEDGDQDPTPKRTQPKWKRWPSLHDDYDDDDDDDDDASSSGGEDQADDFRLSLSLSALGKYKQNHHLPQVPPSGRGEEHQHHDQHEEDDQDDDSPRPSYKSSFSYSSSGFGSTGGFVNHSNTRSIHSATSNSSSPDPGAAGFTETTPTHVSRPSLSRGSLSTATGGLSSTPSPPESSSTDSLTDLATATTTSSASTSRQAKKPGPLKVPLPPNVYRSLEEGEGSFATSRSSLDEFDSAAATPFDGDPFASTAPAGTAVPPSPYYGTGDNKTRRTSDEAGVTAVDLDWTKPLGPVDPRTYSAITGLRDIRSFVCEQDEAGKGAYGSVRRARERGPDGKPIGPELIIKYVIKQRILADCWKKHKILGPIPIEVHVLDHLRRVPYEPRPPLNYIARRRNSSSNRFKGQPLRRDSAPKLDLWHGGEDGGIVRTGHPNICPLLDYWEDSEFYFLVMPQATAACTAHPEADDPPRRGQDLFDYVDAHPDGLAPNDIHNILAQVADALWFLHEHSIVHRDIKDENVAMDPTGLVRLIDFGSAAYVKESRKFDTFSGTLDFAAPEVLKGARYGGKEQDVWALGVLGYVLVCGECPFWSPDEAMQGISPDTRAFAALHSKALAAVPSPEADGKNEPTISLAVDLVMRCLEIDPLNRPTADMICDHAFLVGQEEGWQGERGWENVDRED